MVTSSTFTRSVFTRSVFERIVHGSRVPLPGVTLFLFLMLLPLETAFAQSTVATPVFSAGTGTYATAQTVSIVTPTSGATIRYTTNGSAPSDTTGTVYTEPVTVSTTTTLRAIAYLSGYTNSAINTAVITIVDPPGISGVSPSSGSAGTAVTISGSGFGATRGSGSVWLGSTLGSVVSWSDTQIVATVASMSASGSVAVQQGGIWSEMVSFTVNTPEISGLSPSTAAPEAEVTVSGSNFGSTQGTSQIWLGTAPATVQSWSDTEIVALVGTGALSGNARVLRGGVFSNSTEFTVDVLHLTAVDPNLGTSSTSVTITGTGFGSTQGSSSVVLGSLAATVTSWSDTEIVATVASSSLTGVAKVQRNGSWTNTTPFTVPSSGGVSGTLSPSALNLVVGDTHVIQALSSTGQPVTGLTWASSNTSIVSLSTADPPVLTAVAAGHATITAGDASADVTVSADPFPLGTVIWSNPGDGSGVDHIVPAVPSANGVADVFSFQYSGSIQALTGDGTVAWTVDASAASQPYSRDRVVADFDGGLVLANADGAYLGSLVKLDGITGETASTYTPPAQSNLWTSYVPSNLWWPYSDTLGPHAMTVHTDGTIFAGLATDV
ncbi:MAG: IPT/TIG domain-containing protein, partial [Bryobacteraceae bacterium]